MSTSNPEIPAREPKSGNTSAPNLRHITIEIIVFGSLVVLAIIGLGIYDYSAQQGFYYWLMMALLIGGTNIVTTGLRARHEGKDWAGATRALLLHWGGLFVVLYMVHLLHGTVGGLNSANAGLVALLVLALGTFLAGVHSDRHFTLVGILLGIGVIGAAYVEAYFWIVLATVILVVVLGGGLFWWRFRTHRQQLLGEDAPGRSSETTRDGSASG